MGSDESHFNVPVGSDGQIKSQDSIHKPHPFGRERRAEAVSNRGPSAYQLNDLPLGQTGSRGSLSGIHNNYTLHLSLGDTGAHMHSIEPMVHLQRSESFDFETG